MSSQARWLLFAITSGGCAALNGVFAKLTTTQLTTTWAHSISLVLNVPEARNTIEYFVRGLFFALNLAFNGVMWGLFTRALTLSNSTVRVSVINTSANFMVTALLGAIVFREDLPALLMSGSVIIGRRDEDKASEAAATTTTDADRRGKSEDQLLPETGTTTTQHESSKDSERKSSANTELKLRSQQKKHK